MRYERDAIGDEPQCENCGQRIDKELARVVGNNNGNIPECRRCRNPENNSETRSNTRAAIEYYSKL